MLEILSSSECPVSFNVSTALSVMAERRPEGKAIIYRAGGRWRELSFRELEADTALLARGLERAGIRRGTRTAVMLRPGPDLFAVVFALFRIRAVPVLIDPGIGRAALGRCLEEAAPEAFIGVSLAQAARVLFGWGRRSVRIVVTSGPRLFWGGWTLERLRAMGRSAHGNPSLPSEADDVAAILFTSGSTGAPKGAVYSHGIFAAQVAALRDRFGIRPGEIDLPTFPLFALFAPALGMTAVVPEMDFTRPGSVELGNILGPVREFQATTLFGSPALLDRVGRQADGAKLPTLRRVICAGAPVSPKILERFARLLDPAAEIVTPYGATEALPVAVIGHREILGETRALTEQGNGTCVGKPLPGLRVEVIRVVDAPIARWSQDLALPRGEVGEIAVKGPVVTREYFNRSEDTALAKIRDRDGEVWHRMGDLGYFDERGRLWFCGRKSQRVQTEQGTLYSVQVEGVFNAHPKVRRTALVGVDEAPRQRPVLCVEPEEGGTGTEELKRELLMLGTKIALTRDIKHILFHPSFPVDIRHNAKIFREKLAAWAAEELGRV